MIYAEKEIKLKDNRTAILRSAQLEDAAKMIEYMRVTAAESPYLLREPEEVTLPLESEERILKGMIDSATDLMLTAWVDGKHAGNCSVSIQGNKKRILHRCGIAIALYQEYCGLGLGRQMLSAALEVAKECGYEQAELGVIAGNERAVALYESLGFGAYGTLKHAMKYKDGSYADEILMMKDLR